MTLIRRGESPDTPEPEQHPHDELQVAAAALMVEAAQMDERIDEAEEERIVSLLADRFGLTDEEAGTLFAVAHRESETSVQLYRFTQTIKDRFSYDERVELIEMLWDVAYTDGKLHQMEESLLRRVAGLIYVEDRDRGAARKRVLNRRGIAG